MDEKAERADFEAWISEFDCGSKFDRSDWSDYDDFDVQRAWAGWQARAALAAAPAPAPRSKADRVHAIVDAGPYPGMSAAFDAHMGAECWTDPAYRQDAATWAAAWKAAVRATAAPAPASVLAYMAVHREGEVRLTDNAKAADELERDGWAITPLSQAPAPAQHPDTADAERWRHIWQCVRMAQHGEYVLMPDDPTGLPDDSIVRARFLQEVDAARAQAQKVGVGHNLAKCNETLRAAGKAYPRTCAECGLGPCRAQAQGGKP